MRKYYSYPLLFLVLAASIGLFLRWQFIHPTPGVRFSWFVHSHSHVMFLGWTFNVLYLGFIEYYFPAEKRKPFLRFFWILLALVIAMMISFPLQGYGTYSIIFSTLHTLMAMVLIVIFFVKIRHMKMVSLWFAKISWIFFFLSTAGPFSLGYLMANDLGHSIWYHFSIYYYLHFQYNGFFLFGIFSLFYQLIEQKQITFDPDRAGKFGMWMAVACIPAYALSVLFAKPGWLVNVVGAGAAALQLFALFLFLRELQRMANEIHLKMSGTVRGLFVLVFLALSLKSLLQLASAHPFIAEMAYELRPIVIAYLHLVLLGVITLFLLGWYITRGLVRQRLSRSAVAILIAGFVGSQISLVMTPWWNLIVGDGISSVLIVFGFSALLWVGMLLFYAAFVSKPQAE